MAFRVAPGWHVYWRTPGDAGLPPGVDWAGSSNVAGVAVAWPYPSRLVVDGLRNNIYPGSVVLPLTVRLLHPGAPLHLHAHVTYAACGEVCVPYAADLSLDLPAGPAFPSPEAPAIAAARGQVPQTLAEAGMRLEEVTAMEQAGRTSLHIVVRRPVAAFTTPELFVEGDAAADWTVPHAQLEADGHVARFTMTAPASVTSDLRLTLVDAGHAAEFWASVPPCPGARASSQARDCRSFRNNPAVAPE